MTQLNILATGQGPDHYAITGEVITAYHGDLSEEYDLGAFPEGGVFQGADKINGVNAIVTVERIGGELRVTLCQQVIAGQYPNRKAHWRESGWMDAASYVPDVCYCIPTGMAGVEDYEVVRGKDVAGVEGWTVRRTTKELA